MPPKRKQDNVEAEPSKKAKADTQPSEPAVSLSLNLCLHYDLLTTLQKRARGRPPKAKRAQTVRIPPNR